MLNDQDRAAIAAAISKAEQETAGEISCVLAEEVSHYREVPLIWAVLAALVLPPLALALGFDPARLGEMALGGWTALEGRYAVALALSVYAVLQAVLFAVVAVLGFLTPVRRFLTPRFLRRHRVRESARRHFLAAGAHCEAGRPYVLIFAARADHAVEILASEEIHQLGGTAWDQAAEALVQAMKAGRPGDGFVAAVTIAGHVLSRHFPPDGRRHNELPDVLVET
ncbi:MAG: TPM domain-containing protein [Alphaproteobacteria bacterium]|nr:TPM domain-containing protein [Alphaproteobacteria bacterium]